MSEHTNITHVADIVSAYVIRNHVAPTDVPALIGTVHRALAGLGQPAELVEPEVEKLSPAQVRKSITEDGLVSFIDGKTYQTLKRHLGRHGLTPQAYRKRYGLPADYPMTSASFSARRAAIARAIGLGQHTRAAEAAE